MHYLFLALVMLLSIQHNVYADVPDSRSHVVVVSIAPYQFFVEAIAGETVEVKLLVPPGASFHHYEPTPKQVLDAVNSDIWFRVGESFETRVITALQSHNPQMRIVDLRKGVNLIVVSQADPNRHACCHHEGADLHIWLSPAQSKIQAQAIAQAFISMYPEHTHYYEQRLQNLLKSLDDLDQEICRILKPVKNRTIMVAHPAYAYFARDYHLSQLPIEYDGKDPTPRQLTSILEKARESQIKTVFVQRQYGTKGAMLIANELGAKLVVLDPYSGDYFKTLRTIAERIAEQESLTNPN